MQLASLKSAMHRVRSLALVCSLVVLASSAAEAIATVRPPVESGLCGGDYVFLGRILSVADGKSAGVQADIVVTRILGVRPEVARDPGLGLRVGQKVTPHVMRAPDNSSKFPPVGGIAFDEWLEAVYQGREVLLTGGPGVVAVWPLDRRAAWAQEALKQRVGSSCPAPL